MADYQLTATDTIIRTADSACIPPDPANRDYAEYLNWSALGNTPDPYVPPEPMPPVPNTQNLVLLDHENRVRVLEGAPVITMEQFMTKHGL